MTISVYHCAGHVYFIRCATADHIRTRGAAAYRAEAYRAIEGRKLQQVLDEDGRPVEAEASTMETAATWLVAYLEACLAANAEHAPVFPVDGYVLHGSCRLSGAHTRPAP